MVVLNEGQASLIGHPLHVDEHGYIIINWFFHIPVRAAQWRMKKKWFDFQSLKIPGSEAVLPHHWAACALQSRLLRLCVIRVEQAISCFPLR